MAYSFLAISDNEPNWEELHSEVFNPNGAIEMFPIEEDDGKSYLGISIPSSKLELNPNTWDELVTTITTLKNKYSFKIFDLYHGFFVDDSNIDEVKSQLIA
jgi:hypothetical protein